MSRCCAQPAHAATAPPLSTSQRRNFAIASSSIAALRSGSILFVLTFSSREPASTPDQVRGHASLENALSPADEADDVLGRVHGFLRDRLRALGAVDQD